MSDLGYSSYKPPRGPETPEDMEWVADCVTRQLKTILEKGIISSVTTEDVIEAFRDMNDDYDDWWARGLNTREKEQKFMNELLLLLKHRGIEEVEDNTFT